MSNQTEKKIMEDFILFHFVMKRFLDKKKKVN